MHTAGGAASRRGTAAHGEGPGGGLIRVRVGVRVSLIRVSLVRVRVSLVGVS